MAWLLDTNVLLEGRKPNPERRVAAFYATQRLDALYISVVNIAEIRFGIELQTDLARRGHLTDWAHANASARICGANIAGNRRHPAEVAAADGRRAEDRPRTHIRIFCLRRLRYSTVLRS